MFGRLGPVLVACLALAACGSPGGITHTDIPPLAGHLAAFDQAVVDPATQRLYLADGGLKAVDVFDASQNPPRFVTSVKLGHAPHGLAVADDLQKVFVGMDGGAVAILEARPGARKGDQVLATVQTTARKNVDLVDYDPASHVLWAASSDDGILTRIDAIRNLALDRLTLPAGLEQPRHDPADGMLYLPVQSKNLLLQIDPKRLAVSAQWSLGRPCSPAGLAIDPKRQVALIGCLDPAVAYTMAWDLKAGRLIRTLAGIGDADQVIYDAGSDTFLVAGSSNGTAAIGFFGGSPVAYRSLKVTHADSRAVAYNPHNGQVYTPDAKPGNEGLLSFPLPRPEAPAPPLLAPLLYLLPLLLLALPVWYFGRRRQEERRRAGRPMYS